MELAHILRYVAVLSGLASGVLALFYPLSIDKDGHRRPTRAGWILCGLIAFGAVNALLSLRKEDRKAVESAQEAKAAEAARRREVNAQTPLRRLTIAWTFDQVPPTVWRRTSEPVDPCHEPDSRRFASRQDEFYPFLASLGAGRWDARPVVLLVALDSAIANVLPLGMLDVGIRRVKDELAWHDTDPARLKGVAATIDFRQDLEQCVDRSIRNVPAPVVDRPRRCDVQTALKRDGDRVTLQWDLDPVCIAKGVDRADASVAPNAQLPDELMMVLMTSINDFPASPENFAAWDKSLLWTPNKRAGRTFSDHSRVKLVANGLLPEAVEYEMRAHPGGTIAGKGGGAEFHNEYPILTTWESSKPTESTRTP